jgi:hypothetical protein
MSGELEVSLQARADLLVLLGVIDHFAQPLGQHRVGFGSRRQHAGEHIEASRVGWIGHDEGDRRPSLLVPAGQLPEQAGEPHGRPGADDRLALPTSPGYQPARIGRDRSRSRRRNRLHLRLIRSDGKVDCATIY